MAVNTAIFSVATGLSRIAGLAREVVAASYFGTLGAMSAFTLAFQVPNLIRSLFADTALAAAFVPVFSELLEHKRQREALHLAASLFGLILAVGGAITGLFVGVLNAYEHFTIPAIAPLVWNLVIIGALVGLTPLFEGDDRLYAYAIGVLAGTVVQLVMTIPPLRRAGFPLRISVDWRDPRIARVLKLMLPVTIGLGLINFNLLINSILGSRISEEAPAAIDRAFRIYMLPQGVFSVALAEPIPRLVYERGDFDAESTTQVAEALFWFSFSLPFAGANLLLTRTYFSLQKPWTPTVLGGATLVVNAVVSAALYGPFGIGGVVIGTV